MMKTFNYRFFIVLSGLLLTLLTVNCSDKKSAGKTESADTTAKTESVIQQSAPPFQKFVVVTVAEESLYKQADADSPNLMRWIESDCESDFCENIYQWSDLPGKPGFEVSTDIMACEGVIYPVLGEEGDFYKVCTLSEWCSIESAYIPKASVGDIECAPIKADMLEAEEDYFKCRVLKEDKYKDIVLIDNYEELEGEKLQVGVLTDGIVAIPLDYHIFCNLNNDQKEDIVIDDSEDEIILKFTKSVAMTVDDSDIFQLDLKKLSAEQTAKIVDTVIKKKPKYVEYMYHFPAQGLLSFIYFAK